MKLIGSKTEHDIRIQLVEGHRALFHDPANKRLLDALNSHMPTLKTAYVLGSTPEQGEDIFCVLVNGDTILAVEIDRRDLGAEPLVRSVPFEDYTKALSRSGRIALTIARDLAEADLRR